MRVQCNTLFLITIVGKTRMVDSKASMKHGKQSKIIRSRDKMKKTTEDLRIEFMDEIPGGSISLSVDEIQLKMLMSHVLESTNGIAITKEPWYYQKGSFYESHLNYNCITNCNQWVGSGLRKARLSNRIWFPLTIWI
jgi:hypothetical protein